MLSDQVSTVIMEILKGYLSPKINNNQSQGGELNELVIVVSFEMVFTPIYSHDECKACSVSFLNHL